MAPRVPASPGPEGIRLSDLPSGWATSSGLPPSGAVSVLPRLATCLGLKLGAVTGEALRTDETVFRSGDEREWVTGSLGPAVTIAGGSLPPKPDVALVMCAAAAVLQDLTASGFGSVHAQAVSLVQSFSSVAPRSLDLRIAASATVFGLRGTMFVDLVWIADHRTVAVFDVVNEVFRGDLQSADVGLIDQATDAVARRLSGR